MNTIWIMLFVVPLKLMVSNGDASSVLEKEEIRKTIAFPVGGTTREIVVDNISGSIDVVGYNGDQLELVAHRTTTGDTREKLDEGKKKITLEITQEPGKIILYVDAPWRCHDGRRSFQDRDDYGFDAEFDFEVRVPANTDIDLSTVNNGAITVEHTSGRFDVHNVNGKITMSEIEGSGNAKTVNGSVAVGFSRNPRSDCGFSTVNGSIEVVVPDELSADLKLKTFNGQAYTDFDVAGISRPVASAERTGRRTIYRGDEFTLVRAGKGGPELKCQTLNGDIRILKAN